MDGMPDPPGGATATPATNASSPNKGLARGDSAAAAAAGASAALPWSMTRSVSVVAHFVHCPGGASNKQTVKMANYR